MVVPSGSDVIEKGNPDLQILSSSRAITRVIFSVLWEGRELKVSNRDFSSMQKCQFCHSNWVRLAQNRTNLDFLRSVSVRFGSLRQNVPKMILKSPRIVPFGANLTQIGCQI